MSDFPYIFLMSSVDQLLLGDLMPGSSWKETRTLMKIHSAALSCFAAACFLCLPAKPLGAQTQIGGGTCSSATLTGPYSLTLSGRDAGSSSTFTKVLEGIGTATFDGESKVTFSLNSNTN